MYLLSEFLKDIMVEILSAVIKNDPELQTLREAADNLLLLNVSTLSNKISFAK